MEARKEARRKAAEEKEAKRRMLEELGSGSE